MRDGAAGIRPRPLASTELGRAAQSVVTTLLVAEDRSEAGNASVGWVALEPVSCPVDAGGGYVVLSGGGATQGALTVVGCGELGSCDGAEERVTTTWLVAAGMEDWMAAGLGAWKPAALGGGM